MDEQHKLINQLIEFGYSEEISKRAIKQGGAKTIDDALNWIEKEEANELSTRHNEKLNKQNIQTSNTNDSNTNDNKVINGEGNDFCNKSLNPSTSFDAENNLINNKKLTPEEAQQKAIELQKKIREKKLLKEKEEEIQKEKNRLAMAKDIQKRNEQLQEFERKKYLKQLEKEKEEHKKEREKQIELLKLEYKAKFGIDYLPESEKKKNIEDLSENERREEIAILFNTLKNKYKNKKNELISSLNVLKTYFSNIKNNILEKKFQKIKKENKTFIEKIKIYDEMVNIFLLVGFEDTGDFYVIKKYPNTYLLGAAIKFIDLTIKNLS
ncbi:conserved protein, unknown function [Hepatocystis sp. ex Piliocolobus tephrosceles]|nr:conserved protein, unknown function [Hepatocystis sp. ex Piliocolobus tephrosceles]